MACCPISCMSESPEVERNYNNPKGRSNIEKGAEPPLQKTDPTEPVETAKKPSNPKMPPSGNLEHAGQTDNTRSS